MKNRYFIHTPLFRLLAPVVYGIIVYLLILLINNTLDQLDAIFIGQEVYICIALTFLSFESIRLIIVLLEKNFPDKFQHLAVPIQLFVSVAISLLLVDVCLSLYFRYVVGFSISNSQLVVFSVIYGITALMYNVVYFSNYYLNRENTLKLTAEKQQQEVLEMEITEFKNDINPDLLYESLESTIGLMYRSPEKAEEYIDSLAATYRYSLTNRHNELISIQEEVQAARNVIDLLNEHYFGQLKLQVDDSVLSEERMIIPGSLPLAVENLVRNTIISRNEPLIISCYFEDDEYLVLQCKLNDRLMMHETSNQLLKRLQKSYTLYSDKPMVQVKAYADNYIKFPVVKMMDDIHPL